MVRVFNVRSWLSSSPILEVVQSTKLQRTLWGFVSATHHMSSKVLRIQKHQQVQIFPIASHSKHTRPIASHSTLTTTQRSSTIKYIPHISFVSPRTILVISIPQSDVTLLIFCSGSSEQNFESGCKYALISIYFSRQIWLCL
jgi:hypothetical protein